MYFNSKLKYTNPLTHGTVNDTIIVGYRNGFYYRTIGEILSSVSGGGVNSVNGGTAAAHTIVGELGLQVLDSGTNLYKHVIVPATGFIIPTGSSLRVDSAKHADTTRGAYTAALWANHAYAGPYVTNSNMSGTSNTLGMFTGTNSMGNSLLAQSGSQTQTASSFQVGTTGYSATPAQLSLGDISNTGNSRPVIIGAWGAGGSWGIGPKSYTGNYDVQIGNVTASATDWAASQVTKLWCTFFGGTADSAVAADRALKLSTARVIGKSTTFDGTAAIIPDSSLDAPMWAGRTWGTSVALADSSRLGTYRYAKTDAINGLLKCNGFGIYSAITDNSGNWNTAYGWGNWASNFGTTVGTICQGNDSRLSDSRAPNGSASGDLTGSYPGPTVAHTNTSTLLYGDSLNVHGTIIQKNGNVGIGTTNPSAKLHLNGSALTWAVQSTGQQVIGYAANTAVPVGTGLAINANVGIGTASPDSILTVAGAGHFTTNLQVNNNITSNGTATVEGQIISNASGQSIKGGAWSWMGDYGGQPSIGSTVGSIAVRTTNGEAAYFSASETDIDGTLHAPSQNISGNDTVGTNSSTINPLLIGLGGSGHAQYISIKEVDTVPLNPGAALFNGKTQGFNMNGKNCRFSRVLTVKIGADTVGFIPIFDVITTGT